LHTTKLIQQSARYSWPLQRAMQAILKEAGVSDENMMMMVHKTISSFQFTLPKPNISTKKAQFEELNTVLESMPKLLDVLLPSDMLPDELQDTMKAIRAGVLLKLIRKFITAVGFQGNMDVPDLLDTGAELEMPKVIAHIANVKKAIETATAAFSKPTP